jgi:hypothetical protein
VTGSALLPRTPSLCLSDFSLSSSQGVLCVVALLFLLLLLPNRGKMVASSLVLLTAPLALAPGAWALPNRLNLGLSLGSGQVAEVSCEAVTVTETVYLPEPTEKATSTETASSEKTTASPKPETQITASVNITAPKNNTGFAGYRNALYFTNWSVLFTNFTGLSERPRS